MFVYLTIKTQQLPSWEDENFRLEEIGPAVNADDVWKVTDGWIDRIRKKLPHLEDSWRALLRTPRRKGDVVLDA